MINFANVNYPVKVTFIISMKSGGSLHLRGSLGESDCDLIATLYQLVVANPRTEEPRQLSIVAARREVFRPAASYQTVGGETVVTDDGLNWEKLPPEHDPKKPCEFKRYDCQLTEECGTEACPERQALERKRQEDRMGQKAVTETEQARKQAEQTVKRRRKKRQTVEASPPPKPGSYKPRFAEVPADQAVKNTCGEQCLSKVVHCHECAETMCMYFGRGLGYWSACNKKPDTEACRDCEDNLCQFSNNPDRVSFCMNYDWCPDCENTYCVKKDVLPTLPDKPANWYRIIEDGVLTEGVPYCATYPDSEQKRDGECNGTCLNEPCPFFRYRDRDVDVRLGKLVD